MDTILALICLISPFLFFGLKASITYGQNLDEILYRWKSAKMVALFLFILYAIFIIAVGHNAIAGVAINNNFFFDEWGDYYLIPGIAFSLVILSRPASEILDNYTALFRVNLEEDAAFIIGWAMLLGKGFLLLMEWL